MTCSASDETACWTTGLVNTMHASEIPLVLFVQGNTPHWLEVSLQVYTECIHPMMAFTVLVPFFFALGRRQLATQLILVMSSSDLLNFLLKWILAGDRPYWANPEVRQFPMTCEAGFGMPSGHVQSFATLVYFFLALLSAPAWVYLGHSLLIAVGAYTRVYTGAHFPSQTLAGWFVGACFGHGGRRVISSRATQAWLARQRNKRSGRQWLIWSLACLLSCSALVILTYRLLKSSGYDPSDSFAKAQSACTSSGGVVGLVVQSAGIIVASLTVGVALSLSHLGSDDEPLRKAARCFFVTPTFRQFFVASLLVLIQNLMLTAVSGQFRALKSDRDPDGPVALIVATATRTLQLASSAFLGVIGPWIGAEPGLRGSHDSSKDPTHERDQPFVAPQQTRS